MSLSTADQGELLLPLYEGLAGDPPFGLLLRNLRARTGADRLHLCLLPPEGEALMLHAGGEAEAPALAGFVMAAALRPGRVYALDELLEHGDRTVLARQRAALSAAGARFARLLRVAAGSGGEVRLMAVRGRGDFGGADAAILSALAPHFTVALKLRTAQQQLVLRAALAEDGLARLGIGQVALGSDGAVLAADARSAERLRFDAPGGGRLRLPSDAARTLAAACASGKVQAIARGAAPAMLLRPGPPGIACIAAVREDPGAPRAATAPALMTLHGLSLREAELALGLSRGETIAEAAGRLGLTEETARNYSKRIYAKTGARGQADLVRLILSGLAPLA